MSTTPTIYSQTEPSPIQGWRLLLEGPFGCGKSTSLLPLLTLHEKLGLPEPLKLRILGLDPNLWPVFGNTEAKISMLRTMSSFDSLRNMFKFAQELDNAQLQVKDFRKSREDILVNLVDRLMHFVGTDKIDYGCAGEWGTDTVLIIDGLTGLTELISNGNLGPKPAWTQGDYQRVQNCIGGFLSYLTQNCYCHIALIAHVEWEDSELNERVITPSTAGRKLGPKLGRGFSDIVFAEKKDGKYLWSTTKTGAALAARHLQEGGALEANASQLFTSDASRGMGPCGWLKRGGIISPVVPRQWTEPEYYKV